MYTRQCIKFVASIGFTINTISYFRRDFILGLSTTKGQVGEVVLTYHNIRIFKTGLPVEQEQYFRTRVNTVQQIKICNSYDIIAHLLCTISASWVLKFSRLICRVDIRLIVFDARFTHTHEIFIVSYPVNPF